MMGCDAMPIPQLAAPPCGVTTAAMRVGDHVIWDGRLYVLSGVDPMSVVEPKAYLEDPISLKRFSVPFRQVVPTVPRVPERLTGDSRQDH
jgi:hypothetical protein